MMYKLLQKILLIFLLGTAAAPAGFAQEKTPISERDYQNEEVEMADSFRAEGKIYVVLAVILCILGGMFAYLFMLDRRISKWEKLQDKN